MAPIGRAWVLGAMAGMWALAAGGSDAGRYRPARAETFEFAQAPRVTREGDRITVAFAVQAACDVTVAIEDETGRIVRHLASGLLGPHAPAPFEKNALTQTVLWDGKDDHGRYVDAKDACTVRVSLGLKAHFERNLFWHPKKRVGMLRNGFICPQPEGVYVYQGAGVEMVRLYGHDGSYLRTVYPFPANKLKDVKGLERKTGLDGYAYPQKQGYWRCTLTTGGVGDGHHWGSAAYSMAVANGRIALCADRLGRLGCDGSSEGLESIGPEIFLTTDGLNFSFGPGASALSPDGKTLYLTGYAQNVRPLGGAILIPDIRWRHGVYRMDLESDEEPKLWLGQAEPDDKHAKDYGGETALYMPAGICCDAQGNVYVADFYHDRVRVFSPQKKLLATIPAEGPSQVQVHHRTGEIYVFSWAQANRHVQLKPIQPKLRKFHSWKDPRKTAEYPLPLKGWGAAPRWLAEVPVRAALDSWADPPRVWLMPGWPDGEKIGLTETGIQLFREGEKKLELVHEFQPEVDKAIVQGRPPEFQRQRLYVDPRHGTLYVGEGNMDNNMTFDRLVKVDPDSGRCAMVELPYSAEDLAIDQKGHAYLRTTHLIGRFQLDDWREVPFDYGEEAETDFGRTGKLIGGLVLPSTRPVYWHQSGLGVTSHGDIVVHCYNAKNTREKSQYEGGYRARQVQPIGKPYTPRLYPGRFCHSEIHVWDARGKLKRQDIVQGLPGGHGTLMDRQGNVWVLAEAHRLLDGKQPYGELAGTLMKFPPGSGRLTVSRGKGCPIPLEPGQTPKTPPALASEKMGQAWLEGAEWTYAGIGIARPGAPCQCWNTRFDLDYFGRAFAPETDRFQVAVLDSAGNLILRIGRYGNVDSAGPQSAVPLGGDEVGLFYPVYVATHTDRRLFIADPGNGRIVGVKLGYHAEKAIPLSAIPDRGAP